MKNILLIFAFTGSSISCTLVPKDFSKNPLSISNDEMSGNTFVSSNWLNHYCVTSSGYIAPYFGLKDKSGYIVLKSLASSKTALYYRQITAKCGSKNPITIIQNPFENWNKNFETSCGQYSCITHESGQVVIQKPQSDYILDCEDNLRFRISGDSLMVEFIYTKLENPNFFKGLADLRYYRDKEILGKGFKFK